MAERRDTERILLKFPIRVSAFGGGAGEFTEEAWTVEVNRTGARISLKHAVAPDDTIRIVNLENLREADFRVLEPIRLAQGDLSEWGVECLEPDRNLWDIKFSAPLQGPGNSSGALLVCGDCGAQSFCNLQDWGARRSKVRATPAAVRQVRRSHLLAVCRCKPTGRRSPQTC